MSESSAHGIRDESAEVISGASKIYKLHPPSVAPIENTVLEHFFPSDAWRESEDFQNSEMANAPNHDSNGPGKELVEECSQDDGS